MKHFLIYTNRHKDKNLAATERIRSYLQQKGQRVTALIREPEYKNRYENQKVTKSGSDYKLSAIRIPRNDKTGLPAHFIITKTKNGFKIKEEYMGTNVQKFLNAK